MPFLGLGLFFTVMIVREAIASAATYTWQPVPCQIIESEVREAINPAAWFAYLRYTWSVGESVRSSRTFPTYGEAVHFTRRLPAGSSATCYLDPRDPAGALLERRGSGLVLALFLPLPLLFVFIGAMGFYTAVFRVKLKPRQPAPLSPVRGRQFLAGSLMLIGSVLFLAFLLGPIRHALAARSWRAVDCKIVRSEIRRYRGNRGSDRYAAMILYSYDLKQQGQTDQMEHRSDTYSFFDLDNGYSAAQRRTEGYRPGSTVTCYVNPDDPDDATLHRDPSLAWLVGLLPLALLVGGLKVWPGQKFIQS